MGRPAEPEIRRDILLVTPMNPGLVRQAATSLMTLPYPRGVSVSATEGRERSVLPSSVNTPPASSAPAGPHGGASSRMNTRRKPSAPLPCRRPGASLPARITGGDEGHRQGHERPRVDVAAFGSRC